MRDHTSRAGASLDTLPADTTTDRVIAGESYRKREAEQSQKAKQAQKPQPPPKPKA